MTYQSLYRKYRPSRFEDVVGQGPIVKALSNAISTNKLSHAYLFTGPRGTGKTTMAKLLAKAINCENDDAIICGSCQSCLQASDNTHPDIVEIDAASNNGVDDIRGLIERVKFAPILGKYKVYIIDEVHMLSVGAFNALLKTLEEPPSHVVFILATTEIHKVLPTIISRCQRYDFSRINDHDISMLLDKIVSYEHRDIEPGASDLIASLSSGGMRNALTILEQAMVLNDGIITRDSIYNNNGMVLPVEKIALFENLSKNDITLLLDVVNKVLDKSVDVQRLTMDIIRGLKDSLVYTYTHNPNYINVADIEFIEYIANYYKKEQIIDMMNLLLACNEKLKFSSSPAVHFEIAFVELYNRSPKVDKGTEVEGMISFDKETQEPEFSTKPIEKEDPSIETIALDLNENISESVEEVEVRIINDLAVEIDDEPVEEGIEEIIEDPAEEVVEVLMEEAEEAVVAKPAKTVNRLDMDLIEIVELMVSADKALRIKDSESFTRIKEYLSDLSWAREAKLLNNTEVALSGERFILVVTRSHVQAREIQDEANLYFLLSYTQELLGEQKQVFATTGDQFTRAVELFKDLSSKHALPEALSPDTFVTMTEDKVDPNTERVLDLFGDLVQIKE
jgi:DNA polymerase III subunit gamma/tau